MSAPKTILVVEDEGIVARDLQLTLAGLGYDVPATAGSAEQALQVAAQHRPDLVLMDIHLMGGEDGIEAAALLRQRFDVPVVFLSAYSDSATLERAKRVAPYGYLVKPVHADELRSTVEMALSKHAIDARTLAQNLELERRVEQRTAELRLANEALERSNAELHRFAQVAAHDLQTPMRAIASFADLLSSHYALDLDERGQDWLRRIRLAVKRQQTLLRGLIEYQRLDQQAQAFEPVPMRELFDQAAARLAAQARETGAELRCEELPRVVGERSQLALLLFHLLDNALKHRGADAPRVLVSAEREGGAGPLWRFAVRDNGPGIPAAQREQIFEMFRHASDTMEFSGAGLGLALCRRVVQRHGGRIWAESEPGLGSVFYFTLPVVQN